MMLNDAAMTPSARGAARRCPDDSSAPYAGDSWRRFTAAGLQADKAEQLRFFFDAIGHWLDELSALYDNTVNDDRKGVIAHGSALFLSAAQQLLANPLNGAAIETLRQSLLIMAAHLATARRCPLAAPVIRGLHDLAHELQRYREAISNILSPRQLDQLQTTLIHGLHHLSGELGVAVSVQYQAS